MQLMLLLCECYFSLSILPYVCMISNHCTNKKYIRVSGNEMYVSTSTNTHFAIEFKFDGFFLLFLSRANMKINEWDPWHV